jgi:hypothetical protein
MESNQHLSNPQKVVDQLNSLTKFWPILSEEDQDYIHACQIALNEKMSWDV